MLGLTPIAGAPTGDFHNDLLFIEKASIGGIVLGGTAEVIRIIQVDGVGGLLFGGSWPKTEGTAGTGYPIYGDFCYGDMPYIERQQEMEGGFIAGGQANYIREWNRVAEGGFVLGGSADYVRIWNRETVGGMIFGGYGDEQGDFSKLILATFLLKWPEAMFVPPSEKWDIPNILRSLE